MLPPRITASLLPRGEARFCGRAGPAASGVLCPLLTLGPFTLQSSNREVPARTLSPAVLSLSRGHVQRRREVTLGIEALFPGPLEAARWLVLCPARGHRPQRRPRFPQQLLQTQGRGDCARLRRGACGARL